MEDNMQTTTDGLGGAAPSVTPSADTGAGTPSVDTSSVSQQQDTGGSGFASPQNESQKQDTQDKAVYSANGGFKMVFDEKTGRNRVMVVRQEQPAPEGQQQTPAATVPQAEALPRLDVPIQTTQQQPPVVPQPQVQQYTLPELSAAMELNAVDETRIPAEYKDAYYNLKAARQAANAQQPAGQQETQPAGEVDQAAEAQKFYTRIDSMAQERAMQEVGITQDEIDVGEYTDDEAIIAKYRAYQVAKENNKAIIFNSVNQVREEEARQRQDTETAKQQIISFTNEMKQKEPNFDAIDRLMVTRVNTMPYAEAQKIVPVLQKLHDGTISTADLPALQKYFEDTRLLFYSQKTGVGIAPQVVKPTHTETPGTGAEMRPPSTPLSVLGKLGYRDKIKAIGQMFRKPQQ